MAVSGAITSSLAQQTMGYPDPYPPTGGALAIGKVVVITSSVANNRISSWTKETGTNSVNTNGLFIKSIYKRILKTRLDTVKCKGWGGVVWYLPDVH